MNRNSCCLLVPRQPKMTLPSPWFRFFLFPYIVHFFHASYPLKKAALSCWTSWFQSSTSSCTHLAWSRCHQLSRRVMGHRIPLMDSSAGVPKITLGEFCFRCSHGLRCFHFGKFWCQSFRMDLSFVVDYSSMFFWQRWFWLVVGFFGSFDVDHLMDTWSIEQC